MKNYSKDYCDDREEYNIIERLKLCLGANNLESQVEADDILVNLSTSQLFEWFNYCKDLYEQTTKRRYRDAMSRIKQIAMDRKSIIESDTKSIHQYVVDIKNRRMRWPIAIRTYRYEWGND